MGVSGVYEDVSEKKMIVATGLVAMVLSADGVAYAGQANGAAGQACAASYGFSTPWPRTAHAVQPLNGNNAGGVQAAVAEFCP